ncbi:MAG TPA: Dickkopf N-terminal cysteine-rich domain-containing protein [Kofleriaceae bacterium]
MLIAVAACGGDDSSPPSVSASSGNVCDQIAAVACYDLYQCCSTGEIESYLDVSDPESQDTCKSDLKKRCERAYADVEDSLTANRVKFDADTMNTCLKALLPADGVCASVDTALPWTMACMTSAWVGTVNQGGQCFFTYECANQGTQFCSPSQACMALPTAGMACSAQGCALGNYCNGTTCTAQVGLGMACTSSTACSTGLFCDTAQATPVCSALLAGGTSCPSSEACMSGVCTPGTCEGTATTCVGNNECEGHCSNDTALSCSPGFDYECGEGHCSISTADFCDTASNCPLGETCVLPAMCVAGVCQGSVCSENEITVDYCTGALGAVPAAP